MYRKYQLDYFQNKDEAIALKKVIKSCFKPQFIYQSAQNSP